jgi:alanine racemase
MIDISLENLAEVLGARLYGRKDAHVSEVITDSRSIVSSPKALFFALKSERNNGHKYISELIEKGIVNFVVSEDACIDETKGVNFLRVDDTLKALHALGSYHRSVFKGRVIAVIGSNGKTVVKEWLYQLLRDEMEMIRSPKSYNSQIGVPLSLCLLDNRYQSAIIEAGISEPGEMAVLESMVRPHTVVFTSLGEAHQAYFKDRRHKALEKLRMVIHADMLIYSNDYKEIDGALQGTLKPKELRSFTWTMNGNNADVKAESNLKQGNSTRIKVNYRGQVIEYGIPFIDEASVKNSLSCMAYLLANDLLTETIRERFARLEAVEMRIEQKQGINNCLLINDYYNSDLVSLKIAVELLHNISAGRKKTVVLSDIMQSGMSDQELYKKAYEFLTDMKIDRLIGIGEHISGQQGVFEAISEKEFFNGTKAFLMQELSGKFKVEAVFL